MLPGIRLEDWQIRIKIDKQALVSNYTGACLFCMGSEKMNQIYSKYNFIVVPVKNLYLIINRNKVFKHGHATVKEMSIARLLIDLELRKEIPRNPRYVYDLVCITDDENYIGRLKKFKKEKFLGYDELMGNHYYKRHRGALKQIK